MNAKERIVWFFVGVFYYLVLPASCLFSAVSGVIMSCYSFKGTLFFLTGSPSLTGIPLPAALAISVPELVIGIAFVILGAVLLGLYTCLSKRKHGGGGGGGAIAMSSVQYVGDATPLGGPEDENTI